MARILRWFVIALPAFLFGCALVLPFIPGAMGLFSDSAGPWYQSVTAALFAAALFYSYPVTFLCTRLVSDDMFFSPGYFLVLAVYTAAWTFALRSKSATYYTTALPPPPPTATPFCKWCHPDPCYPVATPECIDPCGGMVDCIQPIDPTTSLPMKRRARTREAGETRLPSLDSSTDSGYMLASYLTTSKRSRGINRGQPRTLSAVIEASGSPPIAVYLYAGDQIIENVTTKQFYFQDSLGNTSHVTDEHGTVLERYTYSAFGTPYFFDAAGNSRPVSAYGIRHLFHGQLWTQETGLNDYRNRVEFPAMGIFLQPDPIGFKGDAANLYRFCNNNAVNRLDPLGLMDGYPDTEGYHKYHMVQDTKPLPQTDGYHVEGVRGTQNQAGDRVRLEVQRTVTKVDSLQPKSADTDRRKSVQVKDGVPTIKLDLFVRIGKDIGNFSSKKVGDSKTGEWVMSQGYLDAYGEMRAKFAEQASLRSLSPDQTVGLINSGDPAGKGIFRIQSMDAYDREAHHAMALYWETAALKSPNEVPYSRHTPLDDKGEPVQWWQ